jgi:NAD(P)-dependent dehydrogenase (short-subunit alcohol dehydrogenase family)
VGDLDGRVAVVTGAGRGIGRAIALGFAAEGAHVYAVARTAADLDAVAADARRSGGLVTSVPADVSSEDDVRALAALVGSRYEALHVLVNNAALRMYHLGSGGSYRIPFVELSVADWDRLIAVDLRGPFLTCRLLGPLLIAAGGASVINVSAGAGVQGDPGRAPYSAAKHGLEGLTKTLAVEWREHGVAVNTLTPGASVFTDEVKRDIQGRDASLRFVRPDMLVPAALHLARQTASELTGARVDAFAWAREQGLGGYEKWAAT